MSNNSNAAEVLSKNEIEAWCVVYGIEGFLTVFGNAVAILVFLLTPSLHKRTYYLLVSLAVADFLVGAVPLPMFIYVLGGHFKLWIHGGDFKALNEAQTMVEVGISYASIYSLTAIAIERMLAIMFPWKHSMESKTSYITAIIITWFLSIMTASFVIFYRINDREVYKGFFLTIMVLLSICLLITLVCYIAISVKLLRNKNALSSLPNREHRETQLAITLLLVSIVFLVTWIPFQVVNFIYVFNPVHFSTMSYHYVLATKFLHYGNSLVNPFIYAFRIPEYKKGLKRLFCCSKNNEPDPNKGSNGTWYVKGVNGPQSATNPDNDHVVSMTTV